ncbi:O-acetyl-ADP-ribose deacetylase [Rothia amarae]|uniref:O-acetyl-ADP-ribose deacetylase n=1 Tax=Rothia amarae TaxID=169480 RepID=UPI001245346E
MQIHVVTGDITVQKVDAVVNAANSSLMGGGGVDGAIHRAGGPAILKECKELRAKQYSTGLPPGQAVATTAGDLPAHWVIHTVGPVYSARENRSHILYSCYENSLKVTAELGARSVAFPTISAGVYGWPMDSACQIAVDAIRAFEQHHQHLLEEVLLVAFNPDARAAYERALGAPSS